MEGKVEATLGKCGNCGLERYLGIKGICLMCAERAEKAEAQEAAPAVTKGTPGDEQRDGNAQEQEQGPKVVAQMTVRLFEDGNAELVGPVNRGTIVQLCVAALDLSYESDKRMTEEQARLAAPPKKWSKAWWKEQFRLSRERRDAEKKAAEREAPGAQTRH